MRFASLMLTLFLGFFSSVASAQTGGRPFDWSGFYLGAHGAYFHADSVYDNPSTPTPKFAGAMIGAQIGYNLQFDRVVVGVEGDMSFGHLADSVLDGNYLSYSGKIDRMGTVRARFGYDINGVMPFLTVGVMWDSMQQGSSCPAGAAFGVCALTGAYNVSSERTFTALTLGGGAEFAINRNWSVKADILFARFGKQDYTASIPNVGTVTAPAGQDLRAVARVGVNYRF